MDSQKRCIHASDALRTCATRAAGDSPPRTEPWHDARPWCWPANPSHCAIQTLECGGCTQPESCYVTPRSHPVRARYRADLIAAVSRSHVPSSNAPAKLPPKRPGAAPPPAPRHAPQPPRLPPPPASPGQHAAAGHGPAIGTCGHAAGRAVGAGWGRWRRWARRRGGGRARGRGVMVTATGPSCACFWAAATTRTTPWCPPMRPATPATAPRAAPWHCR